MADQEFPSAYEPVTNIVLVGSVGHGKSATGNSIIGQKIFTSRVQAEGVTKKCEMYRAAIQDGPIINVIDTPGLFDLSVSEEYISKELINCLSMAKEGIHAVLFVLSVRNRLKQEEVESTLDTLQRMFGGKILDYFIVVFTGGDMLEGEDLTLDDYLQNYAEFLTRILRLCRGRKVLFNNRTYDNDIKDEQLKQLLAHVADIRKQNSGIPYTDKLPRKIKEFSKEVFGDKTMAAQEFPSTYEPVTNIVLVGRTGYGKSATGNSLLGQKVFVSKKNAAGVTKNCQMFRAAIQDGPIINVIDTPGLLGYAASDDYVSKEIINSLFLAEEGIHAVLFVLSATNRLAQEEVESTLDTLQRLFGSKILDYFIVLFTGGDELEEDDLTLDDYLQDCPEYLTRILTLCRGRKVLFNNRTYNENIKEGQLKQLLAHVADIKKQNSGIPYTDKLRRKIKELNELTEQEMDIKAKNLAYIEVMKETLQMEHERTMNKIMMAHIVEGALKQSGVSHKKEMDELKDTLQSQVTTTIKRVTQMVEYALKNGTTSNEINRRYMLELALNGINTHHVHGGKHGNIVKSALKISEETHEKEMHQLKNTLQLNDSQTMNMMAQMSAAAHERKMYQEAQTRASRGPLPELECIIM